MEIQTRSHQADLRKMERSSGNQHCDADAQRRVLTRVTGRRLLRSPHDVYRSPNTPTMGHRCSDEEGTVSLRHAQAGTQ